MPSLKDLHWGALKPGTHLGQIAAVFPRIETKGEEAVTEPETTTPKPPEAPATPQVTIEDFQKVGLKVAEVIAAERVPNSKKLLKIQLDVGTEKRQVVAGIAEVYSPEELVGRQVILVSNLKPAKLMGVESQGMILAASVDGKPILARITGKVPNGTIVK